MAGVLCLSHPEVICILQDKQLNKIDLDFGSASLARIPKPIKLSLVYRKLRINFVFTPGTVRGSVMKFS